MDRPLAHLVSFTALAAVAAGSTAEAQTPRIERVSRIGCEDCNDARQFSSIWDIAVTEAGEVLVIDRDAPTLRMFDTAGRVQWTHGRRGAGPGEYRYAMRAALGPRGMVHVLDMRLRRLTRVANDGTVAQSLTAAFFPAGVAARGRTDELVILADNFRGTGTLERWEPHAETPTRVISFQTSEPGGGHIFSPSVAVAPNGDVAFLPTGERYEIQRLSASGRALPTLRRDIPRPRRTPEELAASRDRMEMVGAGDYQLSAISYQQSTRLRTLGSLSALSEALGMRLSARPWQPALSFRLPNVAARLVEASAAPRIPAFPLPPRRSRGRTTPR